MLHTEVMNTPQITKVNPTFHTHEGYTYLEWNGEFYKGCKRCGGEGHYSFNGEHSLCYTCYNTADKLGDWLGNEADAKKWCHGKAVAQARREKAREDKRQMYVRQAEAYAAALLAKAPDVHAFLMAIDLEQEDEKNPFLRSMAETLQWVGKSRLFSDNMVNAVRKAMTQRTEQAVEAAAHPAPAGRVAVTGEITSTKVVEGDYGTAYKILVKSDEGFKVWVSLPKAQAEEARDDFDVEHPDLYNYGSAVWFLGSVNEPDLFKGVKGKRITFTATLEPSKDDVSFAFGSRPTKGSWL